MQDEIESKSNFTATWVEAFVQGLIYGVLSIIGIFTLGLLNAWATIMYQKWVARKTVIEGKQLEFNASFIDLWVKSIIWMLLNLVTLGFYSILGFYTVARTRYFVKRTKFAE